MYRGSRLLNKLTQKHLPAQITDSDNGRSPNDCLSVCGK